MPWLWLQDFWVLALELGPKGVSACGGGGGCGSRTPMVDGGNLASSRIPKMR